MKDFKAIQKDLLKVFKGIQLNLKQVLKVFKAIQILLKFLPNFKTHKKNCL